jgi:hypothetical protein
MAFCSAFALKIRQRHQCPARRNEPLYARSIESNVFIIPDTCHRIYLPVSDALPECRRRYFSDVIVNWFLLSGSKWISQITQFVCPPMSLNNFPLRLGILQMGYDCTFLEVDIMQHVFPVKIVIEA